MAVNNNNNNNNNKFLSTNKTTERNPVDYYISGQVNISQPKLRSEKFDNNNNNNNKLSAIVILKWTNGKRIHDDVSWLYLSED